MSKNNGGPAFPRPKSPKGAYTDSDVPGAQTGMSLRDYFAAAAATGFASNQQWMNNASLHRTDLTPDECVAIGAYEVADAMLAERAK